MDAAATCPPLGLVGSSDVGDDQDFFFPPDCGRAAPINSSAMSQLPVCRTRAPVGNVGEMFDRFQWEGVRWCFV